MSRQRSPRGGQKSFPSPLLCAGTTRTHAKLLELPNYRLRRQRCQDSARRALALQRTLSQLHVSKDTWAWRVLMLQLQRLQSRQDPSFQLQLVLQDQAGCLGECEASSCRGARFCTATLGTAKG